MVPLTVKQIHSMQRLQVLAPELKALQQKYKTDKKRQQEEVMRFYKENKVNPAASCLPLLLQIPIFISLFYVLRGFEKEVYPLYPGVRPQLPLDRPEHHRPGELALVGLAPARRLRREPARRRRCSPR